MTIVAVALFGLAFGSFANAAIDRLPRSRSLSGRSCCDSCGRKLAAWELIPIVSYLVLRGSCHSCRASIGARTPLVEALCASAFGASWILFPPLAAGFASAAFVGIAIVSGVAVERRRVHA